ncbi:MAG: APC family permease [Planctomycetaceae bacterium]|nr:APC family permease [Planctomycetaceae bacterium]
MTSSSGAAPGSDPAAAGAANAAEPTQSAPDPAPNPAGARQPPLEVLGLDDSGAPLAADEELGARIKTFLIGKPLDLADASIYHRVSLVAFLAWVGLGADGLSSSCYGPSEAFANLGDHTYLAVFLSLATVVTVFIISACYSHIIEAFPSGGGGYLVASKLLGARIGVVSGCSLLVDYVLTITVSIAASGEALFGLLAPEWHPYKLWAEFAAIALLIVLNLRGIKESINALLPIFITFLITHTILIVGTIALHVPAAAEVSNRVANEVRTSLNDPRMGLWGMLALLLHAYSMGAGTYTGIEAVSNSMPVMREPRVATAKRTMVYMAVSLSLTAGGLMLAYLLLGLTRPSAEKTMNFLLTEALVRESGWSSTLWGSGFLWVTVLSEGLLLIVAAQAGFIDGPRVLANLARDSWVPHWFSNLSERLATQNGILLMGFAALGALWTTGGNVTALVIMYSINVFLTFTISMIGMCRHWWQLRGQEPLWRRRLALFVVGALFCGAILCVTIYEKFDVGGWKTLGVTGLCIAGCFLIRRHYQGVRQRLVRLDETLATITPPNRPPNDAPPDPHAPTAAILVQSFDGIGVHTMLNALRFMPGQFQNLVFLSSGIIGSGNFKGAAAVSELKEHTEEVLGKYVDLTRRLGMPATSFMSLGTDPVDELEQLCLEVKRRFPQTTFFSGNLVFQKDAWYLRMLHNQTAFALQRRLQWDGVPMVILPTRVR